LLTDQDDPEKRIDLECQSAKLKRAEGVTDRIWTHREITALLD
jgi:hypothetical protein